MKENRKLLREVLKDIRHDMTDEEVLNLLADSKISENLAGENEKYTLGQRAADAIAKFAGSWAFIFAFTGVLILWMVVNTLLAAKAFDPFPFILLNLVLSCVAAIQAPLIMMSQNRQEEKDRRRAENDYKVNLKTEIMIEDLHNKMNDLLSPLIWLGVRCAAEEVVGAHAVEVGDAAESAQGDVQTAKLIVGVGRLVYAQIFRQLLLRQIAVLAQVAQPRFNHNITSVILWSKAISLIDF